MLPGADLRIWYMRAIARGAGRVHNVDAVWRLKTSQMEVTVDS